MSKIIGYLEGTDSIWLTNLQLAGYDTLPVSNGQDGHGLNIRQVGPQQHLALVVGYLHKLVPSPGADVTAKDLLHATNVYEVPVLIVCPSAQHAGARKRLGDIPANATLIDPSEIVQKVKTILGA